MGLTVAVVTALVTGVAALTLAGWTRSLTDSRSRWLSRWVATPLAALAGAGAAVLAGDQAELVTFALLGLGCALLVVVDLAVLRLPDVIVGPLYLVLLGGLTVAAAVSGSWGDLGRAVLGLVVLGLVYLGLALAVPSDLGLGDVKLSGVLGAFLGWLGWSQLVLGGLAAFVVSAVVALVLVVVRRAGRRSEFPFGPCMVLGAVIGAAWGPAVLPVLR